MTPEAYCHNKTASSGSSFYFSFLFLPEAQRRAITAVYAFCREVDDIVDQGLQPHLAHIKLQWWRDEIERCFHGQAQHPVTLALSAVIHRYQLPQEYFEEIINGMEMDLEQQRYADFATLEHYCYRVAGVVGLISIRIFGYQNPATEAYAIKLGTALQLTNILRDVREDAARGRLYLPEDELIRFSVEPESLLRGEPDPKAFTDLMQFQVQRARDLYTEAIALLPNEDRALQRSGLMMAAIYHALLEKIACQPQSLLKGRVRLSMWQKLWIAWRTARQERPFKALAGTQS